LFVGVQTLMKETGQGKFSFNVWKLWYISFCCRWVEQCV